MYMDEFHRKNYLSYIVINKFFFVKWFSVNFPTKSTFFSTADSWDSVNFLSVGENRKKNWFSEFSDLFEEFFGQTKNKRILLDIFDNLASKFFRCRKRIFQEKYGIIWVKRISGENYLKNEIYPARRGKNQKKSRKCMKNLK